LSLIAEGKSNPTIASALNVTLKAVNNHITNLYEKLGFPPGTGENQRVLAVLKFLRVK